MGRRQKSLPDTDEGHTQRLRRATERSRLVLESDLAQEASAPYLGMRFRIGVETDRATGNTVATEFRYDSVDRSALEAAATKARVFTLANEAIYGPDVAASIERFASLPKQIEMSRQLRRMWTDQPIKRAYVMSAGQGNEIFPGGRIDTGTIADRVLYSQLVHADDASDVLNHVDTDFQLWSLAGMIGDWLAVIAHQEALLCWVRPDICSITTRWAGDQTTIFSRLKVAPALEHPDKPG